MQQVIAIFASLALLNCAFFGLSGYGLMINRFLGVQTGLRALGRCAAVGIALYLALCGPLEYFSRWSGAFLFTFLAVGFFYAAWVAMPETLNRNWWPKAHGADPLLFLVLLAGGLFIANSALWIFNNPDDLQGYLVYAMRIAQTGGTGHDPFAYRRFEAGLGGGNYIYAAGAIFGDAARLRIIDIGGGLLILWCALWEDMRDAGKARVAVVLSLSLCLVAFTPAVNMTPEVIAIAMLYVLISTGWRYLRSPTRTPRIILTALLLFALVCLKTTLAVPAICAIGAMYITLCVRNRAGWVFTEGIVVLLLTTALMLPWMAISRHEVGTPLFPVLGVGRLSVLEAGGHPSIVDFAKSTARLGVLMALPIWVAFRQAQTKDFFLPILVALSSVGIIAAQMKFTVAGYRYGYASAAALFLVCLVAWINSVSSKKEYWVSAALLPILLISLSLYDILTPNYQADTFRGGAFWNTRISAQTQMMAAHRLQGHVPPDASMLVRIDNPYRLDFNRNHLFVMDWPGLIGPGHVPLSSSAQVWRTYLIGSGVRYVAYSYGDEAGMSAREIKSVISKSDSEFLKDQLNRTLITQSALASLRVNSKVIFDDGSTVIMRLPF